MFGWLTLGVADLYRQAMEPFWWLLLHVWLKPWLLLVPAGAYVVVAITEGSVRRWATRGEDGSGRRPPPLP